MGKEIKRFLVFCSLVCMLAGNGKAITKTAYVYTPYGYNEKGSERYDILYLMHGWGGLLPDSGDRYLSPPLFSGN